MKKLATLLTKEKQPTVNGKMMTLTFFQPWTVAYRLGQFIFHALLANLFKHRYISSVTSYRYLNKLISEA